MTTEHTPTPWTINEPHAARSNNAQILDLDGYIVVECSGYASHTGVNAKHNAAFIVRAVNSHEALVKALEAMTLDYKLDGFPEITRAAQAALRLAKGEA